MAFKQPTGAHNYIGEFATEALALAFIQASRWDSTKNGAGTPEPGMTFYDTTRTAMKNYANGAWSVVSKDDPGCVAVFQIIQAGVPIAAETITIGADVMEANGAGANINFVIAAAEATMDNLLAAWIANGVEPFFADKIDATHLRFRSALTHQGVIAPADPNVVLAEAMTNYVFDVGAVNVNTLGGRAAAVRTLDGGTLAINATMITAGEVRMSFPGAVLDFVATVTTATGIVKTSGADTFTIANGDLLITLNGGGGDLANTDVVRVLVGY